MIHVIFFEYVKHHSWGIEKGNQLQVEGFVLEPLYLFLSDNGFRVRSITQTPGLDLVDMVLTRA